MCRTARGHVRPLRRMTSPQSPTPSIQCSTGPFWAFELEDAFDILAEAGFSEIEFMVTRDPRTHEPDVATRLAEERGLTIRSVHGPFLAITKTVWGLDPIAKIRRGAAFCNAVGATSQIVHPPYMWERSFARWLSREAERYAADTGVAIAVETMYPRWVAGRRLRAHRWLDPRELARFCPQVAMDTSHLTLCRRDILKSYEVLASRLVHIHLSDNAGDGRDGHLELEQGILPIDRFLGELRRTNYAGAISLELHVGRYFDRRDALVEMLRRNRKYVEGRLSRERMKKGLPR